MFEAEIKEYKNLMYIGLDEMGQGYEDIATDYFSDAAYILNKIDDTKIKTELENMFEINPMDFAY